MLYLNFRECDNHFLRFNNGIIHAYIATAINGVGTSALGGASNRVTHIVLAVFRTLSIELAATYRTDQSVAGMTQFRLSKKLMLGYAYEYSLRSELLGRANGTNELYLQFKFN